MTIPRRSESETDALAQLNRIIEIMRRLRDPDTGCPWDVEQDFSTIAPYTIEEAYEVADAVQRGDTADIRDELGDLLLQVVFQSRIAEEAGLFTLADVARSIADKMVGRHPHVFGDEDRPQVAEQSGRWEAIKAADAELWGGVLEGREQISLRSAEYHTVVEDPTCDLPVLVVAECRDLLAQYDGWKRV